jgi:hypothetical protein
LRVHAARNPVEHCGHRAKDQYGGENSPHDRLDECESIHALVCFEPQFVPLRRPFGIEPPELHYLFVLALGSFVGVLSRL